MLPPMDTTLLAANPKLETLYRDLCANRLNEDGSSRLDAKAVKERQALDEDLRKARVDAARRQIVQFGLQSLTYRGQELPDELRDLVGIAAAALGGQIAEDDREVVNDELERFEESLKPIARALSKQLQQDVSTLTQVVVPEDRLPIGELPLHIQKLQNDVATSRATLAQCRLSLARDVVGLHELYRTLIESSIRILEQTIHGAVARGTKAKADYLALVAEGMSKKLNVQHWQLMQQVYSSEIQDFLKAKKEELEAETRVLRRKAREAEEKLEQYRRARGMEGMVKEYAEILREVEKVKEEVGRLEKQAP